MLELAALFGNNLLPVFAIAGAGYLLAARTRLDARSVSHVAFFLFAPCLVFDVIVDSEVQGGAVLRMVGFSLACLLLLGGIAALIARWMSWSRPLTAAVVLCVLLPNAGNYGLSANLFAFGEEGLVQASLFFVVGSIVSYTVGVLVASLGRSGLAAALKGLPRVPAVWAVVLALASVASGRQVPLPVDRAVELLGAACIPTLLVILGMQLQASIGRGPWKPLLFAAGMRLIGGIAMALLLAPRFGLQDVARQAAVLQAGMPSAVICIILATEYDAEPAFVTSVVLITTLASPLTLTPLLLYLGA